MPTFAGVAQRHFGGNLTESHGFLGKKYETLTGPGSGRRIEHMLKPPAQNEPLPATTKERIVAAALETLKEEGFAGTSARAIARRGDFNQALIFYHFGTLNDLLLAALDRTSAQRMARYRDAVRRPGTMEDRIRMATELYREDLRTGHITVISELIAGSLARPDLGPEV